MATPGVGAFANPLFSVVSFAVGTATGPVLRPPIQDLVNEAWTLHPVRPLNAETAAAMAVEGVWTPDRAATEGAYTGVSGSRMDALRQLIDDPPDLAYLFELWRRGLIDQAKFTEGLQHKRYETDYFGPLRQLRQVLLTPEQLAAARVKGHVTQARQYDESELQGTDNERAEILYQTTGNPPGPETLLEMLRRGIITEDALRRGIVQGNIRPEYVDEYLAMRHPLLTVTEIVNLRLRGWITDAEMYQRAALRGYTQDQTHDLFLGQGRPVTNRQVFIGQRRGGVYDGPTGAIDPPFLKSLQESNIRPEWYNIAWAQRHSYPSAFVIRQLATSGALDPAQTHRVLMEIGWPEWLIDAVVEAWTGTATGEVALTARVKTAQTAAITEIRAAYLLGQADGAAARGWLGRVGVDAADIDGMLPIWDVMREVPQKGLTASQIRKAYRETIYTRDRAVDELVALGLTLEDAGTLLDE